MKKLLIFGSAGCFYDDLKRYGPADGEIMAINRMGYLYSGHIHHWTSLHPEIIDGFLPLRKGNQDYQLHLYKKNHDGSHNDWGGLSGLFACKIGLELGFEQIILFGIPMIDKGGYCYPMEMGYSAEAKRPAWEIHKPDLLGKVFSMSGWTKSLLNPEFTPKSTIEEEPNGPETCA